MNYIFYYHTISDSKGFHFPMLWTCLYNSHESFIGARGIIGHNTFYSGREGPSRVRQWTTKELAQRLISPRITKRP